MSMNRRTFFSLTSSSVLALAAGASVALAEDGGVVFGVVLPLTGSSASVGEDQRRGVELALDKINAEGGVLGKPLKVIVEDSAGNAQTALDAGRKLGSVDKAAVVMGEYSSGVTLPLREAMARQGVTHINIGSSSVKLRQAGSGSAFSVIGLDDLISKYMAQKLIEMGYKTAAIILPNNAYGESMKGEFAKAYEAAGGKIVGDLLYAEGQPSYRRELQQLQRYNPEVFVYSAYGQEAAILNREGFELGLKNMPWFGIYLSMCISDAPAQTVEGQMGVDVNFVGPDSAWYQDAYKAKYGEDFRSAYNGYAYDAVMMAAQAINAAGTTDPAAILAAAAGLGYHGATGGIALDADNERAGQDYLLLKVVDGKLAEQ